VGGQKTAACVDTNRGNLRIDSASADTGWKVKDVDQTTAPVEAFLNMRPYAQWRGAAVAMRGNWRGTANFVNTVQIGGN
jgi:hypothetical protein